MERSAIINFLSTSVPLFKDFPQERLKELVEGSRISSFAPNEAIIKYGEEGIFLGVLLDGEAEVSTTDDSGLKHHVGILKKGDVVGEMSLMTGDKTMANVIGTTCCSALLIPQNLFSIILITHPPAIKYLSKTISERSRAIAYGEQSAMQANAVSKSDDPYGFNLKTDTPMKLLILNSGSSSLKYNLFDTGDEANGARGIVELIGEDGMRLMGRSRKGETVKQLAKGSHAEAFSAIIDELLDGTISTPVEIAAVGHRVVHGADKFSEAVLIDTQTMSDIEAVSHLAPLHNPVNLLGIRAAMSVFPDAPHIAVFDTAFHHTLPPYAYLYGLPYEYFEQKHIRRYGFHGMSHAYVSLRAAQFLKRPFNSLEIVSCHLGNGASMCAIDHGRSVDTSMGLTPAEGLIMGTRCGDIDPAILVHLMRSENLTADDLDNLINRLSGLKGISGISNDMREIEKAAAEGNHRALLATKVFCYQVRKYIGAYMAAMSGLDALIFTGGIGQGSAGVRSLACQGLSFMGIVIDEKKNGAARGFEEICDISAADSAVRVLVVPTDEERMIARETIRVLNRRHIAEIIRTQEHVPVPIEVSAHHIHLSQEHVEALFGAGHLLMRESDLSQPGQFACREKVMLVGPKGRVERVRVLGPARKETQIEISMTEQFILGIQPPIRESGDLKGTPGITLEGQAGAVVVDHGVVCALRHIHMPPEEALKFGLRDKYMVKVRVKGDRKLTFGDVLIRVHPNFKLAMHIDTDEGNAAHIATGAEGFIEEIQNRN
jgi:acetate kinase